MCVYIHIHTYTYIYMHTHIYKHIHIYNTTDIEKFGEAKMSNSISRFVYIIIQFS